MTITRPDTARRPAKAGRFRKRAPIMPGAELDQLILDQLRRDDVPRSAYQLLSALRESGHTVPVMSIYRALDRLVVQSQVERVAALSAFRIRDKTQAMLTICMQCGRTLSIAVADLHAALHDMARNALFDPAELVIEARGLCAACRGEPAG